MESVLVASCREMLKTRPNGCSVDRILEDPEASHRVPRPGPRARPTAPSSPPCTV